MAIAADASPLILFARVGRLDIVRSLYEEAWITPRVAHEAYFRFPDRPGAAAVAAAVGDWIRVVAPADNQLVTRLAARVNLGEAEAIALALEYGLALLIDDLPGRRAAASLGAAIVGSIGVLRVAKRAGLVPTIRPLLDAMVDEGLWISIRLYYQALDSVGEHRGR